MVGFRQLRNGRGIGILTLFITQILLLVSQPASAQHSQGPRSSDTLKSILDQDHPKLVLVLTFDQLRADFLTRFSKGFLPAEGDDGEVGGFRWLMEKGAVVADTHYNHVPLHTGPGHATIMTGASPRRTGIIGNAWHDAVGLSINCVGDSEVQTVGGLESSLNRGSFSPKNMLASTVGDELKLSNNGQSKVIGISIKNRGAILTAGHNADAAVWFDAATGRFVTSTYYNELPDFARQANESRHIDKWAAEEWELLLPEENYRISMPVDAPGVTEDRQIGFPKAMSDDGAANRTYFNRLVLSPYGNEMLFDLARMAMESEKLGQGDYPDILTVSFSSVDSIGHSYGPHSHEMQDTILRADRQLSAFLNFVNGAIPGGLDNVLIVLTADHGGAALPEWLNHHRIAGKRVHTDDIIKMAEEALSEEFPDKITTGMVLFSEPYIRFRKPVITARGIDPERAAEVVAQTLPDLDGIALAFTRKQIETGQLPKTVEAEAVLNGFHPQRAGDVALINEPYCYNTRWPAGSTHGTGYSYDTHVPLIFAGKNIRPGVYTQRSDMRDIAPTLSFLLGIIAPASSEGKILGEIIH